MVILSAAFAKDMIGWKQSTAVAGTVYCGGKPEAGVRIKLFDHDRFDPDDPMGNVVVNSDGSYHIAGFTESISTIDPEVHIKFNCGKFFRQCYKFKVPKEYITKGASPTKTFNAGTIELQTLKTSIGFVENLLDFEELFHSLDTINCKENGRR